MKKVKSISALFVLFLMFSASNNRFPKTGLFVGEKAPNFQMTDSTAGTFDLRDLKGKYVVLNFWASYDASSRISNIRMRQEIEKLNHQNLSFVSVSYDPSRVIFEETVKLDELDRNTQFYDKEGESSDIYKAFRLKKGFGNYLLDQNGVIIAKNFSPEKLTELIGQ